MTRVCTILAPTAMELDTAINLLLEGQPWKDAEVQYGGSSWNKRSYCNSFSAMLIRRESDGSKNLSRPD